MRRKLFSVSRKAAATPTALVAPALHRAAGTKHPVDGGPKRLGTVYDEQITAFRVNAPLHQIFQERRGRGRIFTAPAPRPGPCGAAGASWPAACGLRGRLCPLGRRASRCRPPCGPGASPRPPPRRTIARPLRCWPVPVFLILPNRPDEPPSLFNFQLRMGQPHRIRDYPAASIVSVPDRSLGPLFPGVKL